MAIKNDLAYLYWLHSIEGIGPKTLMLLKKYVGNAEDIYRLSKHDLSWFLNRRQLSDLLESRKHWDIEGEFNKLARMGISFYPYGYPGYPEKLLNVADPPPSLFVRGALPDTALPAVALIGTRKCSGYGNAMAKQLGHALAERGIIVISGMARGIDGIGQRAVCEAGGSTFAVLGCGVDIVYPKENQRLYDEILKKGGIISEYKPKTPPRSSLFPPRNRIISGLSDAVIVVEAKEKSGTMITVDMALEQGREVYAVPGRLIDSHSLGCNRLIRQGAGLIVSIDEFIDEVLNDAKHKINAEVKDIKRIKKAGYKMTSGRVKAVSDEIKSSFSKEEELVLSRLDYAPRPLPEIKLLCPHLADDDILKILIKFCLKGIASQMGAGYYCKNI